MSQEASPIDPQNSLDELPEDSVETLTDFLDRLEREAFRRSLAHRDPPERAAL